MSLYLLSLPQTATFSVCELAPEEARAIRARLEAAGAFHSEGSDDARQAATFEPLKPDDRATVDGLIDLWEADRG